MVAYASLLNMSSVLFSAPSNDNMMCDGATTCMESGPGDSDGDTSFWRVLTWYGLTGLLLLLGFCVNAYIVWASIRRRFVVRWETYNMNLICASVVDLSLCTFFASVLLSSLVQMRSGSDATMAEQCFPLEYPTGAPFCLTFIVTCAVVVAIRQACVLFVLEDEAAPVEYRSRTVRLLRDVAIVAVACVALSAVCRLCLPAITPPMCFLVASNTTTRESAYLHLIPVVVVDVAFCFVLFSRATRHNSDCEMPQTVQEHSDKLKLADRSSSCSDDRTQVDRSHKRVNCLTFVSSWAVGMWFVLAIMVMAGVLRHPVSIGTLFGLSGAAALDSVWSGIALLCECKYIAVSKVFGGSQWRETNTY